jgi:Ca2+/Na+ antiporter
MSGPNWHSGQNKTLIVSTNLTRAVRHKKAALSLTINTLFTTIWIALTIIFLLMNTLLGYFMSAVFLLISCYGFYYFYRILWLDNTGHPLSEEKKQKQEQYRKQMHNYQRYNLYNRLYRFADATEDEYQVEKNKTAKHLRRR